jgi:hypothetical protein
MKICRTETKSVRPNKIDQNQRKTCFCISKTLSGFNFFAVKIGTFRIAHFHLLPVIHQRFMVLLPLFLKFCLRSVLFILLLLIWRSSDVYFQFFPGLAPLATPFWINATCIKAGQSDRSGIKNRRTWSKFIGHVRRTDVFQEVCVYKGLYFIVTLCQELWALFLGFIRLSSTGCQMIY